jgi:hypothetical protein
MDKQMTKGPVRFLALGAVIAHLAISLIHGFAHQRAGVTLDVFDSAYVAVVITLAPLVAAPLLFTRLARAGAWVLTLAMLAAFVFGLFKHFLLPGTDNVVAVHGAWHSLFLWSAVAVAVAEIAGVAIGAWLLQVIARKG